SVLLFVLNVLIGLRRGEPAPDNPWGAGTLEWATTSPPPPYNFKNFPVVHSRYPVWDTSATRDVYMFEESLERRETPGTSILDAEPEMRVWLSNDSIIPFLAALVLTLQLISQTFNLELVIFLTIIFLALLAVWFWPRGREMSMEWVKAGPPNALPVSTVVSGKGKFPPVFFGMIFLSLTEAAELAGTVVVYFYLRSGTNDWPPGDMPLPQLLIPTLGTLVLLIALIPSYLDEEAVKKGDNRGVIINLILEVVLQAAFIALLTYHLVTL